MQKVNEVSVIFRPKSGAEDRVLQVRIKKRFELNCVSRWPLMLPKESPTCAPRLNPKFQEWKHSIISCVRRWTQAAWKLLQCMSASAQRVQLQIPSRLVSFFHMRTGSLYFFLLQRRSFRRPMELPVVNEDPRKVRVEHNKKYLPKFDPSKTTKCQNQIKSFMNSVQREIKKKLTNFNLFTICNFKVGELFAHCEDGTRTLYYNI